MQRPQDPNQGFYPLTPEWGPVDIPDFQIIDSTLREGEQFINASFDLPTKKLIAKALDDFGVQYIEVTSPCVSEQSRLDCKELCNLKLKAKILTHIRCHMDDAKVAIETGVDGINIFIGTSSYLRNYSHGKDIHQIEEAVVEVIEYIKSKGIEVRFSTEDSFRSRLQDIEHLYSIVDKIGVARVGISDTVGIASPCQVYYLVKSVRSLVACDIEVHLHNDTGCAIANAYSALEAGATHVDTSVLGIGERNGITSLGGLIARLIVTQRRNIVNRFKIKKLRELEVLVAKAVNVDIPFNNVVTGFCAFSHKAGIHTKAVLNNPQTYEAIDPTDFGISRSISYASRLTGWNTIKHRAKQLGIELSDSQCKETTARIKGLADIRLVSAADVDMALQESLTKMVPNSDD